MKHSLISLKFQNVSVKHRASHFVEMFLSFDAQVIIPFGPITKKAFIFYSRTISFLDPILK